MAFQLPTLNYDYDALEPHIDARTMEIHHSKHHGGYTKKLNAALEGHEGFTGHSIEELLSDLSALPESIRSAVRNNGGGYYNHDLFWSIMSPNGGGEPEGDLAEAIKQSFDDVASFKEQFTAAASNRFGSGWAWLVVDEAGQLFVSSTSNQDNPLMEGVVEQTGTPILGLDVWEHAYYLKYQNLRPDYITAWWNVVDWQAVADRFDSAS